MSTPFRFDHEFRAPSTDAVLAAYFEPRVVAEQDRQLEIQERTVLALVDDGTTIRRTSKIVPRRQLPAVLRPFLKDPLHYVETATWRRGTPEIEIDLRFPTLRNTPTVRAVYRVSRPTPGVIQRRYEGVVSVDMPLISSRIERGIAAEFERSMPVAAACTQAFLDGDLGIRRSVAVEA